MKNFAVIYAALLLCCQGCYFFELNPVSGSPRRESAVRPERHFDDGDCFGGDTAILASAVIVDTSYNWRRDSICGLQDATIALFRNSTMILSFRSGLASEVSADYDTHHIIGGHLFTEFSGAAETVIKCDGSEVLRFAGREFLKGLISDGDNIFTLGQRRDSDGFCLRENGTVVFSRDKGKIHGDFQDCSYGETGALYRSGGRICFCYSDGTEAYSVMDGIVRKEEMDRGCTRIDDIKTDGENVRIIAVASGGNPLLYINGLSSPLEKGLFTSFRNAENQRLFINGDDYSIGGWYDSITESLSGTYFIDSDMVWHRLSRSPASIICRNGIFRALETAGGYRLVSEEAGVDDGEGGCHNMGTKCAALDEEGCPCFGITPRDSTARPFIRIGRSREELDINGYISGISTICL